MKIETIKKEKCIFDFTGYTEEPYYHTLTQYADIVETNKGNHFIMFYDSEAEKAGNYKIDKETYERLDKEDEVKFNKIKKIINKSEKSKIKLGFN